MAAEALYTYQNPFSSIYGSGEVKMMEHGTLRGGCAHAMCACSYADIVIGE